MMAGIRQIDWGGETVTARADGWIVTTEGGAPQVAPGWTSRSLGEGMFAITAPGASVRDVTTWSTSIGARGFEPDRIITSAALPNDPSFSRLWGLHNTGQTGGVGDADIDAPEAWNVTTGSRAVVVAVIDTGSRPHADLSGQQLAGYDFISTATVGNDGNALPRECLRGVIDLPYPVGAALAALRCSDDRVESVFTSEETTG